MRPLRLGALFALLSWISGCGNGDEAAVLAPDGGLGGSAGRGGASGASGASGTGAAGTTGSGGSGGAGGSAGRDAGADTGPDGSGGAGPDGGSDAAPDVFVDLTVRGSARTNAGTPAVGLTVVIGNSVSVTDANGEFTIADVPATYDLMMLESPTSGPKQVKLYAGLTTRQPIVRIELTERDHSATVTGTLGPAALYPQGAETRTAIGFTSANETAGLFVLLEPGAGPNFPATRVEWAGTNEVSGRMYALQWAFAPSGLPTNYLGWATQSLSVASGANIVEITLLAVSDQVLEGTVRLPAGSLAPQLSLMIGIVPVALTIITPATGATSYPYELVVPKGITEVPKVLTSRVLHPNYTIASEASARLADSTLVQDLDVVLPPTSTLPIDRATGVDENTEFAWTAVPNAVYCLTATAANASVSFEICTRALAAKIPDTASKGVPLSSGGYTWNVRALGPATSTDELVRGQDLLALKGKKFSAVSIDREFTAGTP